MQQGRRRTYRRDRILETLEFLGFNIVNPNSDSPSFFLEHTGTNQVLAVDKIPERFPEDYVIEMITPVMHFPFFQRVYDAIKDSGEAAPRRS